MARKAANKHKKMQSGRNSKPSATSSGARSNQASTQVRLIAGEWRGRVLHFTDCEGLRPTGSRIRETLFNWLMPDLHNARCLDAFSGSGALGFEALSRGAAHSVMLEPNPAAHQSLKNNAEKLLPNASERKQRYTLFASKAEQFLAATANEPFDVVFLDPPFALDLWPIVIEQLKSKGWLSQNALVYIETPKRYTLSVPTGWTMHRKKEAGNIVYALYRVTDQGRL